MKKGSKINRKAKKNKSNREKVTKADKAVLSVIELTEQVELIKQPLKTLNELGVEHKTDKSTITHCYLNNYAKYFESWRDKEFVLLEIGVASGASIRMWREYFPKAKVYGIDNNPDCAGEGIFIGSQIDAAFLDEVLEKIGTPSIIIDDGSHYAPNTIFSFKHLYTERKTPIPLG
jgi:hypothetical protein